MSRLGWLTPDEIPSEGLKRWLCIPNTPALLAAVTGALLPLTYEDQWELYGTVTPADAALAMSLMLEEFLAQESMCMKSLHQPILFRHTTAQNGNGGTFTLGAWRTRPLNEKHQDEYNLVSLNANQLTIQPGFYLIEGYAIGYNVGDHQIRLFNVDAGGQVINGSVARSVGNVATSSALRGYFQVNTPTTYRIEHRCEVTLANQGMGQPANWTDEIYAEFSLFPLTG